MKYGLLFAALFLVEILIGKYIHDDFIRPYIGDMLVVILLYCLVRVVIPDKITHLPLYIFLFAAALEVMQYFNLVEILGLSHISLARIVIGTTFDIKDIICYAAGCLIVKIFD